MPTAASAVRMINRTLLALTTIFALCVTWAVQACPCFSYNANVKQTHSCCAVKNKGAVMSTSHKCCCSDRCIATGMPSTQNVQQLRTDQIYRAVLIPFQNTLVKPFLHMRSHDGRAPPINWRPPEPARYIQFHALLI
jgi:hypothetical protein